MCNWFREMATVPRYLRCPRPLTRCSPPCPRRFQLPPLPRRNLPRRNLPRRYLPRRYLLRRNLLRRNVPLTVRRRHHPPPCLHYMLPRVPPPPPPLPLSPPRRCRF